METARLAIHARGESWEVALNPEGTVIGRVKPADIPLDSRMISRRHVRIFRDPFGRWIFEDLGLTKIFKSAPPDSAQGLLNATAGAAEVFRHSLAQMHDLTLLALSVR